MVLKPGSLNQVPTFISKPETATFSGISDWHTLVAPQASESRGFNSLHRGCYSTAVQRLEGGVFN